MLTESPLFYRGFFFVADHASLAHHPKPCEQSEQTVSKIKLNDIVIRQLQPGDRQERYFDETLPGFGVAVGVRSKSFFVIRGENRQLTTIGRYPEISLQDARKAAKRLLVEEPSKHVPMRLTAAVATYLEDIEARLRPGSVETYRQHLKTAPDIALKDFKKTSVRLELPNAIKTWKVFANWCLRNELLEKNPFQHIPVHYGQRSRVLSDEEIKAIWKYEHRPYSDIVKLCLLTGQRVGEVTKFNSKWINGDLITIPAAVAKNGREHTFPYEKLTAMYLSHYIGNTFNGFSKAKARMDKETGITGCTVHDLRRTFSTLHARIGTPVHVVEALLNHKTGTISGVAAIYNRYNYLKEMREAVSTYEMHVGSIVYAKA